MGLDLPQLITSTRDGYERRAIELATDAPQLQTLREQLAKARGQSVLFDMPGFVRNFETAIAAAHAGQNTKK